MPIYPPSQAAAGHVRINVGRKQVCRQISLADRRLRPLCVLDEHWRSRGTRRLRLWMGGRLASEGHGQQLQSQQRVSQGRIDGADTRAVWSVQEEAAGARGCGWM
jgi:hypothetical protein